MLCHLLHIHPLLMPMPGSNYEPTPLEHTFQPNDVAAPERSLAADQTVFAVVSNP